MAEASSIVMALGGGSGVDMTALATNLANAQFELRNQRITEQADQLERQISVASSLKNTLSMFASALGDRVRNGDLAVTPTLGNPSVASASSPPGTSGTGTYSLEVLALAKSQTLSSSSFASSTTTVGAGTLTLRFGQTSGTTFTEDTGHAPVNVTIPSGATLSDVANAINGTQAGVTAYVANTVSGAQLVLKGPLGVQNGFILEATETVGEEGLAALAWNPSAGGDPAQLLAASADASFKLDGLAMTSASNSTGIVAPGLSLELTGTNTGAPTTIGFSRPNSAIASAMADLVGALNEIAGELRTATDPLAGELARDSGARTLQRTLSALGTTTIMPNATGDAPKTLSELGLAIERDGSFRLDTARLQATLERDPAGAAAMFTPGLYGVFATIDKIARNASSTGDPGSLAGSIARFQKQSMQLSEDGAKLAEQQERLRSSLVSRFAKADTRISQSKSTLSFLQAQIDVWNAQGD